MPMRAPGHDPPSGAQRRIGLDQQQQREHRGELQHPHLMGDEGQADGHDPDERRGPRARAEQPGQPRPGVAVEREDDQRDQVVAQHRVAAQPGDRRERQPRQRLRLGEGERPGRRVEDRRVPVAGVEVADLELVPLQRPQVEQGHGPGQLRAVGHRAAQVGDQRPRHRDGHQRVQGDEDRPPLQQGPVPRRRLPDQSRSTTRNRFPSGSRKVNIGGTYSPMSMSSSSASTPCPRSRE